MKWFDVFNMPGYISQLEKKIESDKRSQIEYVNKNLLERVSALEKQDRLLLNRIAEIDKYIQVSPIENEIDQEGDDFIDIDENYRIPIVDGVRVRQEGQSEKSAVSINVMSPREATKLYGSRRSRQTQSKIKH